MPVPPETLSGPVTLRALTEDDWPLDQRLSQDPDVVRGTYYPAEMDAQQARDRILRFLGTPETVRRYVVVDLEGRALGTCGIGMLDTGPPRLFYALLPEGRGRGAATAAAGMLAEWAIATGYPEVGLETVAGNVASERVAARAGFRAVRRYEAEHRGQQVLLTWWVRDS